MVPGCLFAKLVEAVEAGLHFLNKLTHILIVVLLLAAEVDLYLAIQQAQLFQPLQFLHFLVFLEFALHGLVIFEQQEILHHPGVADLLVPQQVPHEELDHLLLVVDEVHIRVVEPAVIV